MSSTDEKIRARRAAAEKMKRRNQRRQDNHVNVYFWKKFAGIAALCLCILLVLALLIPQFSFVRRLTNAMKVGNETVSSAVFSYDYSNLFWQYYQTQYYYYYQYLGSSLSESQILSMLPINRGVSLTKQQMSEGLTYADYFKDETIRSLSTTYGMYQDALAHGKSLTEDEKKEIEEQMDSIKKNAQDSGYSLNRYLDRTAQGLNEKELRHYMEVAAIASDWYNEVKEGYSYTEADLKAYYNDHKDDFDYLTLRYQLISLDSGVYPSESVLSALKLTADNFYAGIGSEDDFAAKALAYAKSKSTTPDSVTTENTKHTDLLVSSLKSINEDLANWALDADRKVGDCAVIPTKINDADAYYVAYMLETAHPMERATINAHHLLIAPKDSTSTEEVDKIKADLQLLMDAVTNTKKGEIPTAEEFLDKVNAFAENDTRATVEDLTNIRQGQTVASFNDWIFDAARKSGDMGIVETSYGWHLIYFDNVSDTEWKLDVENAKLNADLDLYSEDVLKQYPTTEYKLGTEFLRSEPIP